MRIRFETTLACSPDTAWRALHTPRIAAALGAPFVRMQLDDTVPLIFRDGDEVRVPIRFAGVVPIGVQVIKIEDAAAAGDARTMRDVGHPVQGPLTLLDGWHHQMTVAPGPEVGTTTWTDELTLGGALAPLLGSGMWALWQWRRIRLQQVAPQWQRAASR